MAIERAPDFRLQNEDGAWRTLSDLFTEKESKVLLVFYPGDNTPVCTRQLWGYSQNLERFTELGIRVVGVSVDTVESHREFRDAHQFRIELLSDPGRVVTRAYGVQSKWLFGIPTRGVFLVDRTGAVLFQRVEATGLTHPKADPLLQELTLALQKLSPG